MPGLADAATIVLADGADGADIVPARLAAEGRLGDARVVVGWLLGERAWTGALVGADAAKRAQVQQLYKQRVRAAEVERDARMSVLDDDDDAAKPPARAAPERKGSKKALTSSEPKDALDDFLTGGSGRKTGGTKT